MNTIYLDHNSSTPIHPEVVEAMRPYLTELYGNPSSAHQRGQNLRKAIEEARENLRKLINAKSANEIVFTSGGTEANNMALKGIFFQHRKKGKRIITTAIEHSSIRHPSRWLSENEGVDYVVVPVQKDGRVRPSDIEDAITPDTILVSVMAANNETGIIQPLEEIAAICRKKNVLFHTDAIQAAGKFPIDVQKWGADLLSASGHKIGAPKGIGFLYIRQGTQMQSLLQGGTQEKNRRGGTENAVSIIGMGRAAEWVLTHMAAETERLSKLRNHFESALTKKLSHTFVNGTPEHRTPNTSNICFDYTDSSAVVMALDIKGIACSNGSACASANPDPSHVLLAMGLPQHQAHASIRFSLGYTTTAEDIEHALAIIPPMIAKIRESHPLWKEAI